MTWILRTISRLRQSFAIRRREAVRYNVEFILSRLDDSMLAHIDVPRDRIQEYAQDVADQAVPVARTPDCNRNTVANHARMAADTARSPARVANDNPSPERRSKSSASGRDGSQSPDLEDVSAGEIGKGIGHVMA